MAEQEHPGHPKPQPYTVYWQDYAKAERLATVEGCDSTDIDPDRIQESREFDDLAAARRFARQRHGYIERVVPDSLRWDSANWCWDWDQELVEDGTD